MKNHFLTLLLILCSWTGTGTAHAQSPITVVAWGFNGAVPVAAQSGVMAIAVGGDHAVALKNDGTVVTWGQNYYGSMNVPAELSGVTAIAAGAYHTVALKNDGSLVAWGAGTNSIAGFPHSGQTTVPAAAQSGVSAIAAGGFHTVALKNDGSVLAWGRNVEGQTTVPVAAQSGVSAIAAGGYHTVALKNDGLVAWGDNSYGQTTVPIAAQSGVTAIAAGGAYTLALKNDGTVVGWGANNQTNVPAGLSGVTAIAVGGSHCLALKNDGTVVAWGGNGNGQATVPAELSGVTAIAAGVDSSAAILSPTRLQFAAADYSVAENGGAVALTVKRVGELSGTHTVDYATQNGSAAAGVDYTAQSGNLTFTPGQTTQTVSILILNGGVAESNETFQVRLSNLTGFQALLGAPATTTVTILDNDTGIQFSAPQYSLWETGGVATITVLRGDDLNSTVTVDYATGNGTAMAGADYTARSGTLHFAAGESALTILIPILDDALDEVLETLNLTLTNPSAGVSLGANRDAVLAILDDERAPNIAVTEAWVHQYSNVVSNSNDGAVKVVRDAAGDIIVTGNSDDHTSGGRDMLTIKYSGADGSVLWQQRYNSPANYNDYATAVAVDASGNVVVLGYSAMVKYAAADGALLWEKRYSGPANSYDYARAVAVDTSGNVVVTGSLSYGSDYYTAKYAAADGALLWEKRYNGPSSGSDVAQAVAVDGSGNVVVTGMTDSSNAGAVGDYYTAKYAAADGALLWEKRYNGPANGPDEARAVAVDGSGNVVVTGSSYGSGDGSWFNDYYTAKYAAADGALLWERRYNAPANYSDEAFAVVVDGIGNVVVTGYSMNGPPNYYSDYYTAKYAAADGALLWEQRYNGPSSGSDVAQAVAVDGSGNVVVTGYSENSSGSADYYTAKYAMATGALLWEKRYNGPANSDDQARAVALDGSGNVVVTGSSSGTNGYVDYYTAKYAARDGALLWEQRHHGPGNYHDQAQAVAVDGSGNVVVTGSSAEGPGSSYGSFDYYTAKYAAADGTLLWEKRYNGPANFHDEAQAVAVDANGNVVVTGYSYAEIAPQVGIAEDYYTAKYAAADGALLWEKRYNGPANNRDLARALAVDRSGNVVVTGDSSNGTNNDYYTAKYAAADGALLWEKRYNGPANLDDQPRAVAVDGTGNVVVTGVSDAVIDCYDCDWRGDYYTAKYAAADGALLWEKRYNGPANGVDYAQLAAVDSSGNVVVTGITDSSYYGGGGDYYTAKYAAVDGALLWEKRYNSPANGDDDTASSLALGPNGMVAITGSSSGDYATVVYWENLPPVSIALVPTGIRLRLTGVPGRSYTIERAPAVTGLWTTLATPTAPISGLLEYVDTNAPATTAFYRTSTP